MSDWLIYGANGYTGELVARLAVARGERPVLAGRNAAAVGALAAELGLEHRVADLRDPVAVAALLQGVRAIAHCAGPFTETSAAIVAACLSHGVHYLDITGEIEVFDAVFAQHHAAVAAGVVLLPGAGFDVVPTDCLAARLHAALPTATTLELAFRVGGGPSRGTALTGLNGMAGGNRVRRDGKLVATPTGTPRRTVPLPSGDREVGSIRWGDLVTAYRSTGIPNITTYMALPAGGRGASVSSLLSFGPLRSLASWVVRSRMTGPDAPLRARTTSEVWGEVTDAAGGVATATLTGPNPYDLTADSVVRAVRRVLDGDAEPGAHTPSSAFGSGYVETLDGVVVTGG
jgi:saccharopine dehydrogenase (NAD+, L-lysine-forming)